MTSTRSLTLYACSLLTVILVFMASGCASPAIPCDALSDGGRAALRERPGSYCIGEEPPRAAGNAKAHDTLGPYRYEQVRS